MSSIQHFVLWHAARLTWTPEGNQLDLDLAQLLDDRHADAVGDELSKALDPLLHEPWVLCAGARITIRSWEFHQLSPRRLREVVEAAVASGLAKVQAQVQWETSDVSRWLEELRRPDWG